MKIGGYLRAEIDANAGGTFSPGLGPGGGNAAQHIWAYDRTSDTLVTRTRQLWTFDVRSQTEFGTLRSYSRTGIQWTTGDSIAAGSGAVAYIDRAFIQLGGFTFGKAVSFFDSYVYGIHSYQSSVLGSEGTAGNGTNMFAYTAQLGGGISATLASEDSFSRSRSIVNVNTPAFFSVNAQSPFSNGPPSSQGGFTHPDIIANLRIDQAWGNIGVSAAAHQANALYYGTGQTSAGGGLAGLVTNGHPADKWGYAAQVGGVFNVPWATGDTFGVQLAYGVGALGYVDDGAQGSFALFRGGSLALGFITDGVYGGTNAGNGSALELTTGWAITAGYEHYWTPAIRTSLYGGLTAITYDRAATNLICTGAGFAALGTGTGGFAPTNCAPSFALWQVGSRTVWNPVKNLDVGLEVIYSRIQTGFGGNAVVNANIAQPTASFGVSDQSVFSGIFRVQRNFWL
jgi:Porin subfamily